jgi:predicted acetyltransferase
MPELIEPDAELHSAWWECHREWGPGLHEDGFGIGPDDEVESAAGFAAWVDRVCARPARSWWIVEHEVVLGGIVLRPFTNDQVLRTGHIGYGVRPSARGQGLATWALGRVLRHAREAGLDRVLLVCSDDNTASIRAIERAGGVLATTVDAGHRLVRHHWIDL